MNLKRTLLIVTVLTAVGLFSYSVKADDSDGELPPIRKLSRGITNLAFGALEIPMKMGDINEDQNGIASVTYGVLKGVCYFIAREVVGIVEVVTFLIPFPGATGSPNEYGWGYGPLMRPEWVVDEEHDLFNIVYPDYPPEAGVIE